MSFYLGTSKSTTQPPKGKDTGRNFILENKLKIKEATGKSGASGSRNEAGTGRSSSTARVRQNISNINVDLETSRTGGSRTTLSRVPVQKPSIARRSLLPGSMMNPNKSDPRTRKKPTDDKNPARKGTKGQVAKNSGDFAKGSTVSPRYRKAPIKAVHGRMPAKPSAGDGNDSDDDEDNMDNDSENDDNVDSPRSPQMHGGYDDQQGFPIHMGQDEEEEALPGDDYNFIDDIEQAPEQSGQDHSFAERYMREMQNKLQEEDNADKDEINFYAPPSKTRADNVQDILQAVTSRRNMDQWAQQGDTANCPPGHQMLPQEQKKETLAALNKRYDYLCKEMNALPVCSDTLRVKTRKLELEKEMVKVEEGMQMFSRSQVFIKE